MVIASMGIVQPHRHGQLAAPLAGHVAELEAQGVGPGQVAEEQRALGDVGDLGLPREVEIAAAGAHLESRPQHLELDLVALVVALPLRGEAQPVVGAGVVDQAVEGALGGTVDQGRAAGLAGQLAQRRVDLEDAAEPASPPTNPEEPPPAPKSC